MTLHYTSDETIISNLIFVVYNLRTYGYKPATLIKYVNVFFLYLLLEIPV